MAKITVRQLKRAGARKDQVKLFRKLFGKEAEVTEALCVKHAQDFDFNWAAARLLPGPALKEYKRRITPAWEEYWRCRAPALKEYWQVTADSPQASPGITAAREEFKRVTASAREEFNRRRAAAFARLYIAENTQ